MNDAGLDETLLRSQAQFSRQSARYGKGHVLENVDDVAAALSLIDLPASARVLDVACGAGHTGLHLASLGHRVTCADLSPQMLERTREAAAARGLEVEMRLHPAEQLRAPMRTPGKLNWGILGTGAIAAKFSAGLAESETGQLVAVGSRTQDSADKFAAKFPGATAHGSYDALLADGNVEAVYISTPHPMHAEWAIKTARAGKHILCEKPLAMNHAEAKAIVDAAKGADVFLMEAFMYRCHPQTRKIVELVRNQTVGDILLIRANFSFRADYDLKSRLLCGALGGGGILDVGCYCASMARRIAGEEPATLFGAGLIGPESFVDEFAVATLKFPGGMLAQLAAGVRLTLQNDVWLFGTEGSIEITNPWFGNGKVVIRRSGVSDPEELVVPSDRSSYALEADEVAAHLDHRQAPAMSWADSLGNMKTLDLWREAVGMVYQFESRGS